MGGDLLERVDILFARSKLEFIRHIIPECQKNKHLPMPLASMLDLGCGDGRVVEEFSQHGYDAHGIELNETLVEKAKKRKGKFAYGNYLPSAVLARTRQGPHVFLQETPDPYELLGKQPDQFDLFFIYPFDDQMPPVFDFFRSFAKPGARLLVAGSEENWKYNDYPGRNIQHIAIPSNFYADELMKAYTVYKKTA